MKGIKKEEGFLEGFKGEKLYYQKYLPKDPRAIVLVVHGMAEHSGRHRELIPFFTERGYGICLVDLRGHGRSGGRRAYVCRFEDFVEDLRLVLQWIKKGHGKTKKILLGHSFGGQISVNYFQHYQNGVDALILSSPNLKLAMKVHPWKKFMARHLSYVFPSLPLPNGLDPNDFSHDSKVIKDFNQDKLVEHWMTLRLGYETLKNLDVVLPMASQVKIPCLILHGEADRISGVEGSRQFYKNMGSKDRTLKTYPGFYHEIFHEIGKEKVFQDMEAWLEKRI